MLPPISPHGFVTRRPMEPDVLWPEHLYVKPWLPADTWFDSSPIFGMPHNDDSEGALYDDIVRCLVRHLELLRFPLIDPLRDEIYAYSCSDVRSAWGCISYQAEAQVRMPEFVTEELLARLQQDVFGQARWSRYSLILTSLIRVGSLWIDRDGIQLGRGSKYSQLDGRLAEWQQASSDGLEEEHGDWARVFLAIKDALHAHPNLIAAGQPRVIAGFSRETDWYRYTACTYVPLGGEIDRWWVTAPDLIRSEPRIVQIGPGGLMGFVHLDDPRAVGELVHVRAPCEWVVRSLDQLGPAL